MNAQDTLRLVALTLLGALPVVLVGVWLTRRPAGDRASRQLMVIALAPVVATWVGAFVAARSMFISTEDLGSLSVIAAVGGLVGVLAAWRLARRIRSDIDGLDRLSAEIAAGGVSTPMESASITELGELGRRLEEMAAELDAAHQRELALERSRRELVAWVSHDLRSPLAGIRAMAEAIEDGVVTDPDDVSRYLRSIGAETDRLAMLVDDLFELSRIASGVTDPVRLPVQVPELLDDVISAITPAATAKGVTIHLDDAPPVEVLVSSTDATRVVRNLLDNAVAHTPHGGTVRLAASQEHDTVAVSVTDECGGIPHSDLPRVFDVAFRGDTARRREDGGGGLGLAIAKGLAEAQQGSIAVSNHPGGCCFTVRFPLAARTEQR